MKWKHKEAFLVLRRSINRCFDYRFYSLYDGLSRLIPGLSTEKNIKKFISVFIMNWPNSFVIGKYYKWPDKTDLEQIGFNKTRNSIFTKSTHCKGNFYLVKNEVDPSEEDR